jgi:hypothetical protein
MRKWSGKLTYMRKLVQLRENARCRDLMAHGTMIDGRDRKSKSVTRVQGADGTVGKLSVTRVRPSC